MRFLDGRAEDRGRLGGAALSPVAVAALAGGLACLSVSVAVGALEVTAPCGITARIIPVEDVLALTRTDAEGRAWFTHPAVGTVEIDAVQHRWADLSPLRADEVEAAILAMQGFSTAVTIDVVLLPGFPVPAWSSHARGTTILLAPSLAPSSTSTLHYLVTHEVGHALTAVALDPWPQRWAAYLERRGLDAASLGSGVPHAERAREILAEDLRYLFGGSWATRSGTIENARLPLPDAVAGLRDLLAGFLGDTGAATIAPAARAWPNPCNPQTTVRLAWPAGATAPAPDDAVLEILDARGRHVRRVCGGHGDGGAVWITWDGCDASGRPASSGVYLYRLSVGGRTGSGRVLVAR